MPSLRESSILLLDEPTTALDLGHQQDMLDLVDALRQERGLTVIATLHDLTLAARYGDRIAVLAEGVVAASGRPEAVLTESLIATYFNASVRIIDDVDGPVIVPSVTRPESGVSMTESLEEPLTEGSAPRWAHSGQEPRARAHRRRQGKVVCSIRRGATSQGPRLAGPQWCSFSNPTIG